VPTGRVVVIGSINVDLVLTVQRHPVPGETVAAEGPQRHLGGKGANQASAAARAGAAVLLVAAVGPDAAGDQALEQLTAAGVDTSRAVVLPEQETGTAYITVSSSGENTILVVGGANARLPQEHLRSALEELQPDDVLLTQLETPLPRPLELACGRLVVNASPLPEDRDEQVALWHDVLAFADPLVVNEHEATLLLQALQAEQVGAGPAEQAQALLRAGAASAVVTAGASGAWWAIGEHNLHSRAPARDVVDTTGAGDAFAGTLAAALASGTQAQQALDAAARAGADAVGWSGSQPGA